MFDKVVNIFSEQMQKLKTKPEKLKSNNWNLNI